MFLRNAMLIEAMMTSSAILCKGGNKTSNGRPVARGILLKTTKYHYQKALTTESDTGYSAASTAATFRQFAKCA